MLERAESDPQPGRRTARALTWKAPWPFNECLVGSTSIAFLLALGRWGSHLRVPATPVYVTDVLVTGAAAVLLVRLRTHGRIRGFSKWVAPLAAVAVLALVRFALGGRADRDALRDLAPYLYALAAFAPLAGAPAGAAKRTLELLRGALLVHLVWVTVVVAFPEWAKNLPEVAPGVALLSLRQDFDSACIMLLVVCSAVRVRFRTLGLLAVLDLMIAIWALSVVLYLNSRAGVLCLLVAAAMILYREFRRWRSRRDGATISRRSRLVALAAGGLAMVLAAVILPQLAVVKRIAALTAPSVTQQQPTSADPEGAGTARARLQVWRGTINYTNRSLERQAFGVGFGPDFLHDAGVDVIFEGVVYEGVRAPHNYLVNTYARMGIVGVLVIGFALLFTTTQGMLLLRHDNSEFAYLLVAIVWFTVATAMVGVILESPFGALPAFWAAGCIVYLRRFASTPPPVDRSLSGDSLGNSFQSPAAIDVANQGGEPSSR